MKLSHHILIFGAMVNCLQSTGRAAENPAEARVARSFVYAQAVDRNDNVYCATGSDGVFVRDAAGIREINNGLATRSVYSLEYDQHGTLYAGCDNGVYRTTNNGKSWNRAAEGLDNTAISSLSINRDGSVCAVSSERVLFLKKVTGIKWEKALPEGRTIATVGTDHEGNTVAASPDGILYRGNDGGTVWQQVSDALNEAVSCILPEGDGMFAGTHGNGVFLWSGGAWKQFGKGLQHAVVHTIRNDGAALYAGTDNGVFVLSHTSTDWTKLSDELSTIPVLSLAVSGRSVYAGTSGFGVVQAR